ncbi:MAG: fucose isomerase [Ignavibacteriae bacterium]|jgi:L-fucose mutarotase|nr:fucose isomerase [Ignavibacteriota bacterium]
MLKNIPPIISPDLIKILSEMGHGDEIVIADGNFPAASKAKRLIRMDGHNACEILTAILKFFPLDKYVSNPVSLMQVVKGDTVVPTIWNEFEIIIKESGEYFNGFEYLEKPEFYERSEKAYAVIASSEKALYANIILKKGVIVIQ